MTISGYFGEQMALILCGGLYMIGLGVILLLFVSICVHHQAFCKIFEYSIDEWNQCDDKNQNDEKFIFDLMQFHISVKE